MLTPKCVGGGKLWPAGMVLAEYLLRNKMDEIEGKKMFVRSNVSLFPTQPQPEYRVMLTKAP